MYALFLSTLAATLLAAAPPADPLPRSVEQALAPGQVVRLRHGGDPGGQAVLLLHGFSAESRLWARTAAALQDMRLVVPDLCGHGGSQACDRYDVEGQAALLGALLEREPATDWVVVGHSMGGMIAQRLAQRHPRQVRALVLVGSGARGDTPPLQALAETVSTPGWMPDAAFLAAWTRNDEGFDADTDALNRAAAARLPEAAWHEGVRGIVDFDAGAQRIAQPGLLLWGDADPLFDRAATQALAASLAQARLEVLPGAGHSPHYLRPEEIAARIRAFVQGLDAPDPRAGTHRGARGKR